MDLGSDVVTCFLLQGPCTLEVVVMGHLLLHGGIIVTTLETGIVQEVPEVLVGCRVGTSSDVIEIVTFWDQNLIYLE